MNTYEWLQTILFFVVLLALVKPLGIFMAKVYQGERTFLSPAPGPLRKADLPHLRGEPEEEMGWKRYAGVHAASSTWCCSWRSSPCCCPAPAAAQSAEAPGLFLATGAQHRGQLHHQHQLAELRRRAGGQLLHPDGGAGGAQLRLRRHRHGHRHCPDPRLCPAQDLACSAISGSI